MSVILDTLSPQTSCALIRLVCPLGGRERSSIKATNPTNLDDPPIEEYHDTRPRVIKIKFDPLPENEADRILALQKNDAKLLDILRQTPSPFYSLIYTSSTGEEFNPEGKHRNQRHWDIFADIVRQKRDPRNRELWKQHKERAKKKLSDEAVSRLPPRAEYERQKAEAEEKKLKSKTHISTPATESTIDWLLDNFNRIEWDRYDRLFSTEVVLGIVLTNVAILGIYLSIGVIKSILGYISNN